MYILKQKQKKFADLRYLSEVLALMDDVEGDPKAQGRSEEISFSNIIASLDWHELQKVITNKGNELFFKYFIRGETKIYIPPSANNFF